MLELAALGALGEADLRALSEHLTSCDECRAELEELRDTAATLMLHAEPVAPPAELSDRILNVPRTPRVERTRNLEATENRNKNEGDDSEESSAASGYAPQQQSWRQRWKSAAWLGALAAVLVLAVLVVALVVLWNRNRSLQDKMAQLSSRNDEIQAELSRSKQRNDELQAELEKTVRQNDELQAQLGRPPNRNNQPEVTTNPREPGAPPVTPGVPPITNENDTRVVELTATGVAPSARARLSYNSRTGVIELTVSNMPIAPAGKTYQLWLLIGGRPVSGGTFITGPGGRAMLRGQIAADALEASTFAVTLEPVGGSSKPTGPKYLLGSAL